MPVQTNSIFRFADVEVHEREFRTTRGGQAVEIEPKAFRVLVYLIRHAGHLVSKSELIDAVWGETAVTDNSLTRAIALLRRVLEDDPHQPHFIETVSTAGYRFICPVETDGAPDRSPDVVKASTETGPALPRGVEAKSTFAGRWRWVLAASVAGVALASGALLWYIRQPLAPPHIGEIKQLTRDVRWAYKRPLGVDRGRVYFSGVPRGLFAVIGTGEIETIPLVVPWSSDQEVWAWELSPDGAYFLAWGFERPGPPVGPLWVFTTSGKPVRYVAEVACAGWSPDGKQVVYSTADGRVYTVPTLSGEPHLLLTSKTGVPWFFSWSPDGKRIRFAAGPMWEMASDGSNLHEFLPPMKDSAGKCCGRWTPDGAFYIFESISKMPRDGVEEDRQLWAVDERSGMLRNADRRPVQLTSGPMQWSSAVISADSRTIFAQGTARQGELVRFDMRTGQFVRSLEGISAIWLDVSPDGKYVAYISYPERKLWRANRDGSDKVPLAEPSGVPGQLRWSPDGTKVVFVLEVADPYREGVESNQIWMITSQGGRPERVQIPAGENPNDPTWSPDGKRLAYSIDPRGAWTRNGIRILDLQTHQSMPLPEAPIPVFSPRWSPDGRYIICVGMPKSGAAFLFDTEMQKWTRLPLKLDMGYQNWTRDSRSVYFLAARTSFGADEVDRISIPDGHVERVVDLEGVRLTEWLGLDPDNNPLLLRDAGSAEIYALRLER
jgi:DNA-binding winged helix-turn-helix (wHTH) protein/Tol biopolymer transport system component